MSEIILPRSEEDILKCFGQIQLIAAITHEVLTDVLPKFEKANIQDLAENKVVTFPVINPDTIAHIRLCDEEDMVTLFMTLSELSSSFGFGIDIVLNEDEEASAHTPYLFTIFAFDIEDPDPDDDGGDDDPAGEKEEAVKVMAVSAGARR